MSDESYRSMDEEHVSQLQKLLGLGEHNIPAEIEERYWQLKRLFDRINAVVTIRDLAFMVFFGGFADAPLPHEVYDVAAMWRDKLLKFGSRVEVKWRKAWKPAKLIGPASKGRFLCQMDGDSEERLFESGEVVVPKEELVEAT